MSSHLLEINMKFKTSEVNAGLKSIENSVQSLIKMANDFGAAFATNMTNAAQQASALLGTATQIAATTQQMQPPQILTLDQQIVANEIQAALEEMAKISPEITRENIRQSEAARRHLEDAIAHSQTLQDQVPIAAQIAAAQNKMRLSTADQLQMAFDMNVANIDNHDLITKLSKSNVKSLKIDQHRLKVLRDYVKDVDKLLKTNKTLLVQSGISVKDAENLVKNFDNLTGTTNKVATNSKSIKENIIGIASVIPGIAVAITAIRNPIGAISSELDRIHNLWKENRIAANNFLKDGKGLGESLYDTMTNISTAGGSSAQTLSQAGFKAVDTIITLDQAQAGLNATLQSSYKNVIQNNEELAMYAVMATQTSHATGLAATETAELALQMRALHQPSREGMSDFEKFNESLADSATLMNSLTNISAEYRFTSKEMAVVTSNLNKNMSQLNSSYKTIKASNGKMIPPAVQYTAIMAAMGNAANKAGQSGTAAMNALSNSIENPLDNIILLGKAAFSTDVGEQMLVVGENAVKFQKMMEGKSLAQQQMIANITGKSVAEINALAAAHQGLQKEFANMSPAQKAIAISEKMADEQAANAARTAASKDAANALTSALDNLTLVFGRLAKMLQPVMEWIAKFLSMPFAAECVAIAGAVSVLVAAFSGLSILRNVNNGMKALAGNAASVTQAVGKSGAGGGGIKGFAEGFVGAINAFKTVNWASMLKAGAMIAIIGISLGIGIAAIGLALKLMPPDKIAEFAVMTTGLVLATGAMALVGMVGPAALIGALALVAVGAALAASMALIGLALNLLPPDGVTQFIALTTGLVLATGIMAGIALVAPLALIGAGLLLATGVALAAALSVIGLAFAIFDPMDIAAGIEAIGNSVANISASSGAALVSLSAGLVAFAAAMAGGSIMSFFSGGIVENATKMGQALTQLVDPIAKLGSLGSTVGTSFTQIADGLDRFTAVLDKGGGLFGTDFQGRAAELASALQTMVGPITEMNKAQAGAMDARAKDLAKVQAEEIKSALAVTLERSDAQEDASLKVLNEINEKMGSLIAVTERSELAAEIKKMVKNSKALLDEVMMGGGMGNSSANSQYT